MLESEDLELLYGTEPKRRRASNYTTHEKAMIVKLTDEFKDIILNKETNTQWATMKRDAWDEIVRRYNKVQSSGARSSQQLKAWYDNHKRCTRKSTSKPTTDKEGGTVEVRLDEDHDSSQESNSNESTDNSSNEQNRENHREHSKDSNSNKPNRENNRIGSIRKQYYLEKMKNAKLQNRLLMTRNRMEMIRYKKEMEILRLKLEILKGRNRNRMEIIRDRKKWKY
ncbi:myb/SANT-like DNA-binding domain-containing protein 4 isoform X2 [Maniola hyperantus]|uniref:myb/SANT-like DNA-binding domain-containing protein 4 isoform X2 n=1 Tax=Aphantopus hyperantus TaxID=2795564 RepID=UPI00374A7168